MDQSTNSTVIDLISDGESDENTKNTTPKSSFGDKKKLAHRVTRSRTRAGVSPNSKRLHLSNPGDNLLTNNKVNRKKTSNKMVEKVSVDAKYKCLCGKITEKAVYVDINDDDCKKAIAIRKASRPL
eukprot:XP_003240549.1 PREDICTED: uncharacterized protein LOC100573820 [Acyrthosiphon pisum]